MMLLHRLLKLRQDVEDLILEVANPKSGASCVDDVIAIASEHFGVPIKAILPRDNSKPKRRTRAVSRARWTSIFVSHKLWPDLSHQDLAYAFDVHDAAVIHALRRLEEEMRIYEDLRLSVDVVLKRARGSNSQFQEELPFIAPTINGEVAA